MVRTASIGAALLLALTLAACDQRNDFAKAQDREAELNARGRYQMLPGPNERVYVLDTGDGSIRICGPLGEVGQQQDMGCGRAASQ